MQYQPIMHAVLSSASANSGNKPRGLIYASFRKPSRRHSPEYRVSERKPRFFSLIFGTPHFARVSVDFYQGHELSRTTSDQKERGAVISRLSYLVPTSPP